MESVEWIDINLPWSYSISWEDAPPFPDLSAKEREIFGISLDELAEVNKEHIENYGKLVEQLRDKRLYALPEADRVKAESDFWKEHENDPCVVAHDAYLELRKKICEWGDLQPEWKDYHVAKDEFVAQENQKSFSGRGLALPGTVVEMEDGSIELIGSINALSGVCNDCTAFEKNAIVKRYAVVYPFTRKGPDKEYEED